MMLVVDHGGNRFEAGASFMRMGSRGSVLSQHTVTHYKLVPYMSNYISNTSFFQSSDTKREDQADLPTRDSIIIHLKRATIAKRRTLWNRHPCRSDRQHAASSSLWDRSHGVALG